MKNTILKLFSIITVLSGLLLTGCDSNSTSSKNGDEELVIQFKTETTSAKVEKNRATSANSITNEHDTLFVSGTNGTLRITDIQFIVSEFELEPEEADNDSTKFEEFESGPFLVDLPLSNGSVMLGNNPVPSGFYVELEFEVENLEVDEDENESGALTALKDEINQIYPEWPQSASMVITGDFLSANSDTTAFKVFAEAEIEIEREFEPALEINEDNRTQLLTIPIIPEAWFENADGSVRNLSEFDWETTNQLLEFEAEFEDGVSEIEFDDYEDD